MTRERTNTIPSSMLLLQQQLVVKKREEGDAAQKQKHSGFVMLCGVALVVSTLIMLAPPQCNLDWEW